MREREHIAPANREPDGGEPTSEPAWPDASGPYLFLFEVSGPLERRLLDEWVQANRPDHVAAGDVQVAVLPTTRRSHRRRRRDPALEGFLAADDDALLVPMRVVWLAPKRDGRRSVRLVDLLRLGDPRDPRPLRQYVVHRAQPDRVRVVMGATDRTSRVRDLWAAPATRLEGRSFVEEVAYRAWLALERAERRLRGNRYKVPKFPVESLVRRREFRAGVARLSRQAGVSYGRMDARTRRYVKEIAATHSPYVIDLVTGGFRWLIGKAYVEFEYDRDELAGLYQMAQRHPLVFLPTHKSHFDHQSLQFALYENGLPPNHTAGGINMNFFPVGPLLRRSGVFFIRREFKDNAPYKFVLRQYIDYLLGRRFPLEWYIEGTRSRTGKLLPPRYGLLAYVVESYLRGSAEDVYILPVSIAYDQIQDVDSYAAEQSGAPKTPESFGWMLRMIRGLQSRYGSIHLRFGAPISLRSFLAEIDDMPEDADDTESPAIPKLAFEIANRINEVTPITPISLVTLVLLGAPGAALTLDGVVRDLEPYIAQVARRELPRTDTVHLDGTAWIAAALDQLALHGTVVVDRDGDPMYRIPPAKLLAAAYYRNTVVHFFVDGAIAELALASAMGTEAGDPAHRVVTEALRIRELLIFEFFFAARSRFDEVISTELGDRRNDWLDLAATGDLAKVVDAFAPFQAPTVLRPFIDAYRIVADVLAEAGDVAAPEEGAIVDRAMTLAGRYLEDGTIRSGESISKSLFENGVRLARHRGLLEPSADMAARRVAFSDELHAVVRDLDALARSHVG